MKIDNIELDESHKGCVVIYKPSQETGTIRSWNDHFVFVEYSYSPGRGVATNPNSLRFEYTG